MLDESFATMRRMAQLPFLGQQRQRVRKGATPSEVVYEEDRLQAAALPERRAAQVQDAAAVRLRAGQPALHPRHPAQQERRAATSSAPASTPT